MKVFCVALSLVAALPHAAQSASANPIEKVLDLISNLEAKVTADGEESKKLYAESAASCEERSANLNFEIKTGESDEAGLSATIAEQTALIASLSTKVDELAASVAKAVSDLKEATAIREKESSDFAAVEQDLTATIDSLCRAVTIIERESRKGGSAMVQLQNANTLADALGVMVQASFISNSDAGKLVALAQQRSEDEDSELMLNAPEAAAYMSQSGGIVKTLEDLLDQAREQQEQARKQETSNRHSFEKLKQGLEDEMKFASKELGEAKSSIASSSETKSTAEGNLAATTKELESDRVSLEDLHQECLSKAEDYEAETKSRGEELKALAEAKQAIAETTGAAGGVAYGPNQVSFLQVRRSRMKLSNFRAARLVRELARKQHSPQLAQLAARISVVSGSRDGADPFAKIKGLISDMIAKLESEAGGDASKKAYCDQELAETDAKDADKTSKAEKLSTKIDQMTARSAQLKDEAATLQKELAELASFQAAIDKLRQEEHETFVSEKADLELGIKGVQAALKTLRDYYGKSDKAHDAGDGAATGIIGLIEVVESDLSRGLAERVAAEQSASDGHSQQTKDNEIEKATKTQDVTYKTAESAGLDKTLAEATADRSNLETELDAIHEYLAKLHEQCDAKAEPYEERAARREAEISGLKDALASLSGESALLQRSTIRKLRGAQV